MDDFLKGADAVAFSIDATIPVLILSRVAKRLKVPLVEGWDVTYGNVRVFTEDTPSLEEVLTKCELKCIYTVDLMSLKGVPICNSLVFEISD